MTGGRGAVLDAVLALLTANGLTVSDLVTYAAGADRSQNVPTVEQYLPRVVEMTRDGARRTYEPYWRLAVEMLGDRHLNGVTVGDLMTVATTARKRAVVRRNASGGIGAEENCIAALRCMFRLAVHDGLIQANPAMQVAKPRRNPNSRRALSAEEMAAVSGVVRSGGNDPLLDTLLLRFFQETAARRGGALALRLRDIREDRQQVRLREKGDTERWQPISKTLTRALLAHAYDRGAADPDDAVFRYRPVRGESVGKPLTRRRLNTLADRIQAALPWAGELGVSAHWIRHTTTTAVERLAGYAVAQKFAGHAGNGDVTHTYVKASEAEVAWAVGELTGEGHPLAGDPPIWARGGD